MSSVADNWRRVYERAQRAAERSGRPVEAITIVAVSKTKSAALVDEAIAAGAAHVGENYIQEAESKKAQVKGAATWHFIGHLQRNKARKAIELFDVVQTVDSLALAQALNRHAVAAGRVQRALIEVNVGGEGSKSGVSPTAVEGLLESMASCRALRVEGLMTIPPRAESTEEVRGYFRMLRGLRDQLSRRIPSHEMLNELSMGMTDDFETAIEEGATIVRIGRAIFGNR